MHAREIAFQSLDYKKTLELRERILRLPLGLRLTAEELARDVGDIHLGMFSDEDELIACLILTELGLSRMKMRQVAVSEDCQGKGVGRMLVRFSEDVALSKTSAKKIEVMELSARKTALKFYEGLGYSIVSEGYLEKGILHFKMEKVFTK